MQRGPRWRQTPSRSPVGCACRSPGWLESCGTRTKATSSATLISILGTINREGPITLGRLAAEEHLAPPSVTKAVDKLVAQGLVERRSDSRDHRVVRVEISAGGRRLILSSRKRRTAWLATRLEQLPPEELDLLARAATVLDRLTRIAPDEDER